MRYVVIGGGGVGSYLLPPLAKLVDPKEILVVDGDTLEEKNLDRQLFGREFIGSNKAAALAATYGVTGRCEYFSSGVVPEMDISSDNWLFCCADNHACRRLCLSVCDEYDCRCIIAANEYLCSEAYYYERDWKETHNDPRTYYPIILTDNSDDPTSPEGCTGHAATTRTPQLVIANQAAATLALWLFWFHEKERPTYRDCAENWPTMHKQNQFGFRTTKKGDRE